MLLKQADVQYLVNSPEALALAAGIYERLVRRLYVVADLAAPANSSFPVVQLLRTTFEKANICLTPLSEAQGIPDEAKTRLSRIQLGQDMFGQSPIWAPRLSYFYYENRLSEMIERLKRNFDSALTDFASSTWSSWRGANEQGRVYKLSKDEVEVLIRGGGKNGNGKMSYSVDIKLSPDPPDMAGLGTNVRIRQIRLWLAKAYVNPAFDDSQRQIIKWIIRASICQRLTAHGSSSVVVDCRLMQRSMSENICQDSILLLDYSSNSSSYHDKHMGSESPSAKSNIPVAMMGAHWPPFRARV